MVTKITKLTAAQSKRMASYAKEWIDIGLCTDPADRPRAEAALGKCYVFAGLQPPKRFVWVQSPIVMAFAGPVADEVLRALRIRGHAAHGEVGDAVDDAVDDAVGVAVDDAVDDAVGVAVDDAVDDAVGDAVRDAVGGAVGVAVGDAVGGAVDDAVGDAVGDAVRGLNSSWWKILGGQFWCWWPAYERFLADECSLVLPGDLSDRGSAYAELSRCCNWVWPHTDFAIMVERPRVIARNEMGRLHRTDGPAVEYRDGWGVYSLSGVTVPAEWITSPSTVDPRLALTHPNIEQRRVLREHLGWQRVIEAIGGLRIISGDPDTIRGAVVEVNLGDDEGRPARFLSALCPSGENKRVLERVDPACGTPDQANAWANSLDDINSYTYTERT